MFPIRILPPGMSKGAMQTMLISFRQGSVCDRNIIEIGEHVAQHNAKYQPFPLGHPLADCNASNCMKSVLGHISSL
jgi:hypothetical protein